MITNEYLPDTVILPNNPCVNSDRLLHIHPICPENNPIILLLPDACRWAGNPPLLKGGDIEIYRAGDRVEGKAWHLFRGVERLTVGMRLLILYG